MKDTRESARRPRKSKPGAPIPAEASREPRSSGPPAFPIVGVGASAGGLEAFSSLLQQLDATTGMAFVLIQHLDPTHTSFLREALVKTTRMDIVEATHELRVLPNHVYVIPPNTSLGILEGCLTLTPRPEDSRVQHLPIDFFFRALAAERGSAAIGVVLSGSASDGTEGLRAITEAGGITFAQQPSSAKFPGMPESAIEAGVVDYCLAIPEIALELLELSRHPYLVEREPDAAAHDAATTEEIFALLQRVAHVDFREYKLPTFERRLARRMALRRATTLGAYLALLRETPAEVLTLCEDALIHVTSFFRDPAVFDSLKTNVFPQIIKEKADRAPIRVWVAGCATGEEVYSLAIALVEFLGDSARQVQMFGSDVSAKSIEVARAGLYPDSAVRDMSDDRRRRFFVKSERGYRIVPQIRDQCVFVQHDLGRDPPFSRIDLLSCRNVLIYFDQALQRRVVPTFHYALSQPGFLLLGRAESIAGFKQLFELVDKTNKVFARTATASVLHFARRAEPTRTEPTLLRPRAHDRRDGAGGEADLSQRLDRLLANRYAPPGVVVNERMDLLHVRGETGAYLRPAPGAPQNNVMAMARGGLAMVLRSTVAKAKAAGAPTRASGVSFDHDGASVICDVLVIPLGDPADASRSTYLILFEEPSRSRQPSTTSDSRAKGSRKPKLEQELAATKEYLQTVIEEHGRTNDDLGSANEELVSGNEELQSMNEELETAKEELQSINEELTTVNDELQARNQEVTQVNSDLVNLLTTVDIPILILDANRRIRRFTPKARQLLNVVATDIGRPFGDLRPNIDVPDLDAQITEVIDTMVIRESEVQGNDGHWYRLQIRPYKTTDNRIDGAIVSLFDIDALKRHIALTEAANSSAETASNAKDEFLATLSHELRTPLSSMLMRAQLLQQPGMDEVKVKRAGEAIESGVHAQVRLIEDLLDVSRIVTGKLSMKLGVVDLAHLVTAAVEGMRVAFERKSQTIVVEIAAGSVARVLGDTSRLQQVVSNLLANAIKFTGARGEVKVSLTVKDDTAVIRVKDTGIGIDAAFLPHVFNRFTQQNSTSTRAHGGLGLGLAIARHIVELHRGTIAAESPGLGLGTTLSVTLPLLMTERVPVPPGSRPRLVGTPYDLTRLAGFRILVVDDDRATRDAIVDVLARTGAETRVAESSAEALQAFEDFRPQMLVSDVAMPGEDGYALIRKVRARGPARAGRIPAIALTALAHDEDRDRAIAAGFQVHMCKPVDMDRLTSAVLKLAATDVSPTP